MLRKGAGRSQRGDAERGLLPLDQLQTRDFSAGDLVAHGTAHGTAHSGPGNFSQQLGKKDPIRVNWLRFVETRPELGNSCWCKCIQTKVTIIPLLLVDSF